MWKRTLRSKRNIFILASIVLVSFALMTVNTKRSASPFFFESISLLIVAPIQSLFTHAVDTVSGVVNNYVHLVGVARDNEFLRRQMDALIRENQVLQEEVRRLQRVGRLLDYQEREGIKTLVATIVGRDATQWVKAVYIDKGSRDGVRENLAVVTNAGVVGHVVQAGLTSSKVLLMVDRRSAIDSIFQQSRVPGIVVGAGEGICEMKYVPITANVQKGDWVLSSGLGSLFPKGLVVGHVSKVSKSKQGLFQEIEILPNADLARLEEVLVLLS